MKTDTQWVFPWAEEGVKLDLEHKPLQVVQGNTSSEDLLIENLSLALKSSLIKNNAKDLLDVIRSIVDDQISWYDEDLNQDEKQKQQDFFTKSKFSITPKIETSFYTMGSKSPSTSDFETASEFFSRLARGWTVSEALDQEDHK